MHGNDGRVSDMVITKPDALCYQQTLNKVMVQ